MSAESNSKRQKTAKVALITGITGQDGSYLAEFLLKKDYEVHGIIRRSSSFNTGRIEDLYQARRRSLSQTPAQGLEGHAIRQDPHLDTRKLFLHYGDLTDSTNCFEIISTVRPDELYNLGAQSHVKARASRLPPAPPHSSSLATLAGLVRDVGVHG